MLYSDFFQELTTRAPAPRVEVDLLAEIINSRHQGVGTVSFRWSDDFEMAQWGTFLWMEEERTSPHEEAFRDAVVFVNSIFKTDRPMRRIIAAKELMHVFDDVDHRADTPDKFKMLLQEVASQTLSEEASAIYLADRRALWKAILALVPPWIREPYLSEYPNNVKAAELAARWWLPPNIAEAAMGPGYDLARATFLP
ncbi:MAG: hypothetical protein ABL881_06025 [Novosphingobium sp.]